MKIELFAIGKNSFHYVDEGVKLFSERISRYIGFHFRVIPDVKDASALSASERKNKEGDLVLREIENGDFLILLDEDGKEFTSREFAMLLQKQMNSGLKRLVFVIGGPYGFSEAVYKRANAKLALSRMTFPHDMVRLVFMEQLYRAFTILKGEKYHHD